MNFFEYECYYKAFAPKINCPRDGENFIVLPWARIGSNYTLAFESFLFVLARELSSDKISNLVLEEDDSITKVLQAVM